MKSVLADGLVFLAKQLNVETESKNEEMPVELETPKKNKQKEQKEQEARFL